MSIHNRYADVPLTEEDFTAFDAQFALIEEIMGTLAEPDKLILRRVPKLGFKSDTFTRDTLMLAAKHEELLPRGLDVQELEAQMALRDALKTRALQMKLMARKMEKIVQILGSDVFSGALAAYKSMKANHRGTMNEQLRELGRLFRNRKKKEAEGPETRDEGQRQHAEMEQPVEAKAFLKGDERQSIRRADGSDAASTARNSPTQSDPHTASASPLATQPVGAGRSGPDTLQHTGHQSSQRAQESGRACPETPAAHDQDRTAAQRRL